MEAGIRISAFATLLTLALPAASGSCSDFKAALAALDTARAVRESFVPFAEVVETTVRKFPGIEERLSSSMVRDVRAAQAKAYSGYTDATLAAHEAAARSVAATGLSDDEAIQAALVLNSTLIGIIKAVIVQTQLGKTREMNKLENFESLAEDFEPVIDRFLETIMAAVCK